MRTNFTRAATWVLVGSLAVLVITGAPLIWRYDPAHRSWYQDIHLAASSVFVVVTFALIVHWCRARMRLRRTPAHISGKLVAALLVLMVVAGGTGPTLAWLDYLVVSDWTQVESDGNGILAIWETGVSQVRTNSTVISRGEYQFNAILHVLVAPLLLTWVAVGAFRKHPARLAARADNDQDAEADTTSASTGKGDRDQVGATDPDPGDDRPVKPTKRTNAKRQRQRENKRQGDRKQGKPAKPKAGAGKK